MGVIVNLNRWNRLSPQAKKVLQDVAIEHEKATAERFIELGNRQRQDMLAAGMREVKLQGAAANRFSQAAREATWNRMRTQMERHPDGLKNYDRLIALFNR
jgi:TRAP-type C4-dicarboxylate transport system substrate-binding protein